MMTKQSKETKRKLLQDIESSGERPSPLAMMRAPKLEHWYIEIRRRGKEFVMVVRGDAYKHPEIEDGTPISTPAIMWRDRKDRFIRTTNRLYVLGQPAGREIQFDVVDI
jgi:hypothetical protein